MPLECFYNESDYDELEDAFGDALVMLESNPSSNYAMCIV